MKELRVSVDVKETYLKSKIGKNLECQVDQPGAAETARGLLTSLLIFDWYVANSTWLGLLVMPLLPKMTLSPTLVLPFGTQGIFGTCPPRREQWPDLSHHYTEKICEHPSAFHRGLPEKLKASLLIKVLNYC